MENKDEDFNKLLGIYLGWAFLHLVLLTIGWNGDDHELFWPFQSTYVSKGEFKEAYDISEFLVYVIGPVVLIFILALFDDGDKN
jgi:hypothetical protein